MERWDLYDKTVKNKRMEKPGVAILILDKLSFRTRNIKKDKKGIFFNDKEDNLSRTHNSSKCVHTQ